MYKLLKYFSLLAFSAVAALSQITGEIRGTIADSSGALMEKAKVTITSVATGESRILESDADGRFAAPLLTIGEYVIKVEKTGFRSAATRAEIQSGAVASLRLALEVGQVSESVTVSGAVTRLDSESAQIQGAIVGEKIQEIPVNRNPNIFVLTMPGIVPVSANNPFLGSGSFNSNGGRGRGNNIVVDGITSTDVSSTAPAAYWVR
jgi:hypothetical protein